MVNIVVRTLKEVKPLEDGVLIEGLPGIGHVGLICAEHIIHEFKGEKFLEVYCDDFPPQVLVNPDGTITPMCIEFFVINEPKPIIVVAGNTQGLTPMGQYHLAELIVKIAKDYGCNKTYTIGGFGTGTLIKEEPKVYVASTLKETSEKIKELGGEFRTDGGPIIGAAGLVLTFSKLNNIEGVCLMGETPGYLVDPKSAGKVLELLSKIVGFKIDLKELEERAKEMEKFLEKIKKFEEQQRQQQKPQSDEDLKYIG